jgi:hypothetical protein
MKTLKITTKSGKEFYANFSTKKENIHTPFRMDGNIINPSIELYEDVDDGDLVNVEGIGEVYIRKYARTFIKSGALVIQL